MSTSVSQTEGPATEHVLVFQDTHCTGCSRDLGEDCPILAAAFSRWPDEWQNHRCTAHWPAGEAEPPVHKCPNTMELPL